MPQAGCAVSFAPLRPVPRRGLLPVLSLDARLLAVGAPEGIGVHGYTPLLRGCPRCSGEVEDSFGAST